jgi:hypothetical protein
MVGTDAKGEDSPQSGKIAYISGKETNYQGDNSYETDMARPFRISHRGGRGQDFDRSVSVR